MTTNSALWLGCAKVEITPEKPMVMGGYGNRLDKSKGTHDPLFARAIYLYDGKKSALIVVCDLVAVGDDLTEILRAELHAYTRRPSSCAQFIGSRVHRTSNSYGLQGWR